jgi:formylglycine-generating enzyme required for sulfatase activity
MTEETFSLNLLSKATEVLLSTPFEWCCVKGGSVTLEDASHYNGSKGGLFQVADFAIAKYPITNAQYNKFLENPDGFLNHRWWDYSREAQQWRTDHAKPKPSAFQGPTLPRTRVSWFDAIAYCRWLSSMLQNIVTNHDGLVRLPTEQEWQRAAIGDTGWDYAWGNNLENAFANFGNNIGQPTPVGNYLNNRSPYHVVDMVGNVWEWCLTSWGPQEDEIGGYTYRVIRGGAWNVSNPVHLRALDRAGTSPRGRHNDCGFRCVYIFPKMRDRY